VITLKIFGQDIALKKIVKPIMLLRYVCISVYGQRSVFAQLCILDDTPITVWNLLFSAAATFSLLTQVLGSDRALACCE
jgi:hypothetical protein